MLASRSCRRKNHMATSLEDRESTSSPTWRPKANPTRLGAFVISAALPILCYAPAFICNETSGCPIPSTLSPRSLTLKKLKEEAGWPQDGILGLASLRVTGYVLAYYLFSLVLQAALPGLVVQGVQLRSGARLEYKFNGTAKI